jgi:hypothetical protein
LNESNNFSTKYFLSKTGIFIISEYEKDKIVTNEVWKLIKSYFIDGEEVPNISRTKDFSNNNLNKSTLKNLPERLVTKLFINATDEGKDALVEILWYSYFMKWVSEFWMEIVSELNPKDISTRDLYIQVWKIGEYLSDVYHGKRPKKIA